MRPSGSSMSSETTETIGTESGPGTDEPDGADGADVSDGFNSPEGSGNGFMGSGSRTFIR